MTSKLRQLSLVIPVFNSAEQITELITRALAILQRNTDHFEIILVNDASKDGSWQVIEHLARSNAHLRAINLGRNVGQHNALLCGIRLARYDTCVTIDDDLQFQPEDIPLLVDKLEEGFDLVYGSPEKQQHGMLRNTASQLVKLSLKALVGNEIATHISPFRAFKTKLRNAFADAAGDAVLVDVLLSWGTTKCAAVKVKHLPRVVGRSNYSFLKLVLCAVNLLTGFTTIPLKVATLNGLLCVGLGAFLLAYVLYRFIENGGSVPGFPFLASVIIIFSGAQLFALGIIGEYIGRMYSRSLNRPPYVVDAIVDTADIESSPTTNGETPAQDNFQPDPNCITFAKPADSHQNVLS